MPNDRAILAPASKRRIQMRDSMNEFCFFDISVTRILFDCRDCATVRLDALPASSLTGLLGHEAGCTEGAKAERNTFEFQECT